jgi:aminopeptidase-like protein
MIKNEREFLSQVFDDLFPICRSITGPGLEASLDYFNKHMPLNIEKIPSNTKVFDWVVPPEWHFKRAQLWGPNGQLICDTNISNLHVVNYSVPVDKALQLSELQPHLHSLEYLT